MGQYSLVKAKDSQYDNNHDDDADYVKDVSASHILPYLHPNMDVTDHGSL